MVNIYGKNVNVAKLQREMNMAAGVTKSESAPAADNKRQKKPSELDRDMYHLSKTYGEKGFVKFLVEAAKVRRHWEDKLGEKVPHHLYRRIGDILFKEEKFKESESFYKLALEHDTEKHAPNSSYTLVQLSKAFIMQGKFDYAKQALRQAYNVKRNIYTAALFGEICFLTGERSDFIKAIVEPYVHEALQKPRLEYAQGMILSLNILTTPSVARKRVYNNYTINNFDDTESAMNHIAGTTEQLLGSENTIEIIRHRNTFAPPSSENNQDGLTQEEAYIVRQYRDMNIRWDKIESSRAISRDARRAAGTSGFKSPEFD